MGTVAHDVPLLLRMPGPPAHARAARCRGWDADAISVRPMSTLRATCHLPTGMALPVLDGFAQWKIPTYFRAGGALGLYGGMLLLVQDGRGVEMKNGGK